MLVRGQVEEDAPQAASCNPMGSVRLDASPQGRCLQRTPVPVEPGRWTPQHSPAPPGAPEPPPNSWCFKSMSCICSDGHSGLRALQEGERLEVASEEKDSDVRGHTLTLMAGD